MADSEKLKADFVVQIGEIKVPIRDTGKRPMDVDTSVDVPSQKSVMANDHEAGGSKGAVDKYHQPRWCPSGLTHTPQQKEIAAPPQQRKEGTGEGEDEG